VAAAPWALLLVRCSSSSSGGQAATSADASIDVDAGSHDASLHGDAPDDRPATPGFDGSFSLDGCAANGTCAPSHPTVIAGGQASPAGIAVDTDSIYWIDLGGYPADGGRPGAQVMKIAKDGGSPAVLASGTWDGASKLGVDDAGVYWILGSSVLGCPLSGCTGDPTVLWSGQGPLYDIAVDSSGIYFTSRGTRQVLRCNGLGGPPPDDGGVTDGGPAIEGGPGLLWPIWGDAGVTFQDPTALAVDSTTVYFANGSGPYVMACDKDDCIGTLRTVLTVNDVATLAQLAVDDSNVYVTDLQQGRILTAPKGAAIEAGTFPSPSVLVDNLTNPVGLVTDGTSVYFTDTRHPDGGMTGAGRVSACSVAGCSNGQTAQVLAGFVNLPLDLAIDSTRVYWTDFGSSADLAATDAGRVMAVAKP
jgi:hypothetical protein